MSKITSRDIKSHQFLLCFKAGEEVSESRRCKEVDCQLQILEYYKDHVASFVDDIDMNRLRMSKSDLLRETKNSLTPWSGESVWRKYGEIKTFINNKVNFFLRQLLDPSFHLKSGWNMDRLRRELLVLLWKDRETEKEEEKRMESPSPGWTPKEALDILRTLLRCALNAPSSAPLTMPLTARSRSHSR